MAIERQYSYSRDKCCAMEIEGQIDSDRKTVLV
jgi:hypothetical protein